jgi:hypothetical protein
MRLISISIAMLIACGGSDDDGDDQSPNIDAPQQGQCANIAGTWGITGGCGADTCDITQNGCSTDLDCSGGAASYTGTINGNSFMYSGTTAGGTPATCTGTINGSQLSGTCNVSGFPCDFSGQRL